MPHGVAVDFSMNTNNAPTKKARTMTRQERANYNAFARDFLTFNLGLDYLSGRKVSLDVWPYGEFRPKAVERLIRDFDPEHSASPEVSPRPAQRRSARIANGSHMAPARVSEFREDTVDDLWRN